MAWTILALGFVLLSGLFVGTLLIVQRSFGKFTETMAAAHKSNMLAYRSNLDVVQRLETLKTDWALLQQIATDHCASFTDDEEP